MFLGTLTAERVRLLLERAAWYYRTRNDCGYRLEAVEIYRLLGDYFNLPPLVAVRVNPWGPPHNPTDGFITGTYHSNEPAITLNLYDFRYEEWDALDCLLHEWVHHYDYDRRFRTLIDQGFTCNFHDREFWNTLSRLKLETKMLDSVTLPL